MSLTKIPLSASTHGRPVKVSATAIGSGDTIHTAAATAEDGEGDEIVLFAYNSHSEDLALTLGWGGATSPDDLVGFTVPAGKTVTLVPGWLLRNGLAVTAAAGQTDKIVIAGYALRSL